MTPAERAAAYNRTFPQYPDSHLRATERWMGGQWIMGQNYRTSGYYGAYPAGLLKRILSLFPDVQTVVHLCSGSLPKEMFSIRIDINPSLGPDICANAERLPIQSGVFELILADLPYGANYAKNYGTGMPNRRKVLAECNRVLRPGGNLVWLDVMVPQYRKDMFHWWGWVPVSVSTNHVFRGLTFFRALDQGA